jgi:hypothetical protein
MCCGTSRWGHPFIRSRAYAEATGSFVRAKVSVPQPSPQRQSFNRFFDTLQQVDADYPLLPPARCTTYRTSTPFGPQRPPATIDPQVPLGSKGAPRS